MTKLSVNINKIATLRNSRGGDYPNLINFAKFPDFEYSARYIPPPTPTGIDIIEAIAAIIKVPVIAGPIPPAERRSSPGGSGSSIKVSKFI